MKKSTRISLYVFLLWFLVCLFPLLLFGENWIILFALYNGDFTLEFVENHISPDITVMIVIATLINATVLALIVKLFGDFFYRISRKKKKD